MRYCSARVVKAVESQLTTHLSTCKLLDAEHSSCDLVEICAFGDNDRALAAELSRIDQPWLPLCFLLVAALTSSVVGESV